MKILLIVIILLFITACDTVVRKPFWIDEQGQKHYQIWCQDDDTAKVSRKDVSPEKWNDTAIGDSC